MVGSYIGFSYYFDKCAGSFSHSSDSLERKSYSWTHHKPEPERRGFLQWPNRCHPPGSLGNWMSLKMSRHSTGLDSSALPSQVVWSLKPKKFHLDFMLPNRKLFPWSCAHGLHHHHHAHRAHHAKLFLLQSRSPLPQHNTILARGSQEHVSQAAWSQDGSRHFLLRSVECHLGGSQQSWRRLPGAKEIRECEDLVQWSPGGWWHCQPCSLACHLASSLSLTCYKNCSLVRLESKTTFHSCTSSQATVLKNTS